MEEEVVRKVIEENYMGGMEEKDIEKHMAGFSKDLRTFRGNSDEVIDTYEGLKERIVKEWDKWGFHMVERLDVKVGSSGQFASATCEVLVGPPTKTKYYNVYSLRKEDDAWKIFKVRWIPAGGYGEDYL